MTKTVVNALRSMAVLLCIAAVCTGVLAVCNMYFPKYTPKLDGATAALVNSICDTGVDDGTAHADGYIVMLDESEFGANIADHNKLNKNGKAEILAVYGQPKGINAGAYVIESQSDGRDGKIVVLVAYKDGTVTGATVKKQGESYWNKLPSGLFESLQGASGNVDLNGEFGKTGATVSLSAIERAVNMSNAFALEYNLAIREAISERSKGAAHD